MTPRRLMACSMLLTALILWTGFCVFPPPTRTFTEAPTPTRLPMTVLPTVYAFPSMTPSPTVTARELLPMGTRVPTRTVTPVPTTAPPTETPVPVRSPIQRG
jgi:hypothetical protein